VSKYVVTERFEEPVSSLEEERNCCRSQQSAAHRPTTAAARARAGVPKEPRPSGRGEGVEIPAARRREGIDFVRPEPVENLMDRAQPFEREFPGSLGHPAGDDRMCNAWRAGKSATAVVLELLGIDAGLEGCVGTTHASHPSHRFGRARERGIRALPGDISICGRLPRQLFES